MTSSWTEIAKVQLAHRDWPKVIIWQKRAFVKATTGSELEKYREVSVAFPTETKVKRRGNYKKVL